MKRAECCSRNRRESEHWRLAPKDFGGGDRCPRHDLDLSIDARLIGVDLQEHIANAQRHALRMLDNDFDLRHVVDHRSKPPTAQGISNITTRREESRRCSQYDVGAGNMRCPLRSPIRRGGSDHEQRFA